MKVPLKDLSVVTYEVAVLSILRAKALFGDEYFEYALDEGLIEMVPDYAAVRITIPELIDFGGLDEGHDVIHLPTLVKQARGEQ